MTQSTLPSASVTAAPPGAKRTAQRLIGILLIALVLFDGYSTWNLIQQGGIQILAAGLSYGMTALTLIGAWLVSKDRVTAGVWLLIVSISSVLLCSVFLGAGQGLLYAITGFVLVSTIASATLPRHHTGWALLLASGMGLLTFGLDFFSPSTILGSGNLTFTYWVVGGLGIIYLAILARQFSSFSLRTKLAIGFISLTITVVIAMGVIGETLTRRSLTDRIGLGLASLATAQAQLIGEHLATEVDSLEAFSLSKLVQDTVAAYNETSPTDLPQLTQLDEQWRAADLANNNADPLVVTVLENEVASELREYRDRFPQNVEIFVTNRYGANVAATNRTSDYYQADEGWWQAAYNNGQGAIYLGQPEFDDSSQTLAIILAIPLFGHNTAEVIGVLRTTLILDPIIEILNSTRVGETGEAELLLPSGQVLKREGTNLVPLSPEVLARFDRLRIEAYQVIDLDGRARLTSLALITTLDRDDNPAVVALNWRVAIHQDETEALASVLELRRITILVGVGAVLVAATVSFFIAQRLSTPIVHLTQVATQIQQGNWAVKAPITTQDEIGTLATTFNAMTQQLNTFIETLEQRVADRTRALTASTEVSRRLSTILDYSQLVTEVVEVMRSAFGYYHVQIYIFDEARTHLVLAGGTGEAGRMMLERGHQLPQGRGLVGRAAETNQAVLVPDTSADAGWLPNPLLPETHSELALPIALGPEVLGVLDVQQNQVDSFNADDVALLQSVANQIAAAINNARSFTRAQQQARREAQLLAINQKILAATTPESVLQIVTHELGHALQARRATAQIRLKPTESDPRH